MGYPPGTVGSGMSSCLFSKRKKKNVVAAHCVHSISIALGSWAENYHSLLIKTVDLVA